MVRRERPRRRGKERGYVQTTTGEIPAGGSAPRSTEYSSRPFLRSPRPISDDSTTMIREDRLGGTGVSASLNLRTSVSPSVLPRDTFRWISGFRTAAEQHEYGGNEISFIISLTSQGIHAWCHSSRLFLEAAFDSHPHKEPPSDDPPFSLLPLRFFLLDLF